VTVLRRRGRGYPGRLLELHDPPAELHLAGGHPELLGWSAPVVAIVGSRRAGDAGLGMARELARGAAGAGALVVSGLALGVDAAAHEGALAAGAPTLAVLGCGPDVAYPRTNRGLYARILAAGLVVSEYPPGTEPAPWRFPARNRLIAALADAVVVVEAKVRSGALITADHALDLGRDVLAVPGWPAFSGAGGTNALLKAGAGLVESVEDLTGWLGLEAPSTPRGQDGDPLLDALREQPGYPDELAARLRLSPAELSAALARLELVGAICRDGRGRWMPGSAAQAR
jgi:DNA processing protein